MMKRNSQSGFTLVEMSIVILILGLLTGAVFAFYTPLQELKYRKDTVEKQKKITNALASFAQQYNRLPCPAAPDALMTPTALRIPMGRPRGYAAATPWGACTATADRHGLVPYRVLGLTVDDIIDGWKRPISYSVDRLATDVGTTAHDQCRLTPSWWVLLSNYNPPKAIFCCQQNNVVGRFRVYTNAAKTDSATDIQPASFGLATFQIPSFSLPGTVTGQELSYFAYVLISHGENGERSYVFGDAARKVNVGAGTNELENANDDSDFVDLPQSRAAGTDYFDDIVVWRTQRSMMSEFGNDSCDRP